MQEDLMYVPSVVQDRVWKKYGTIQAMAVALNMSYTSAYSVLRSGGCKSIETLMKLSHVVELTPEHLGELFLIENQFERKREIEMVLGYMSLNEWARQAGMARSSISGLLASYNNLQIRNVLKVAKALNLSLTSMYGAYFNDAVMGDLPFPTD